jgi:centrosomal protein CEP104
LLGHDPQPNPAYVHTRAHATQIPTKIEVYVAPPGAEQPPDGGAPAASKRLGYLSFDSNERSGHQARELKSVHVSIDAAAIRLVVHRCHVNKLNIYNQVRAGRGRR